MQSIIIGAYSSDPPFVWCVNKFFTYIKIFSEVLIYKSIHINVIVHDMGTVSAIKNELRIQYFFLGFQMNNFKSMSSWLIFSLSWFFSQTSEIMVYYIINLLILCIFFLIWRRIVYETLQMHVSFFPQFDDWFLFQVMHFVINRLTLLHQKRRIQELWNRQLHT